MSYNALVLIVQSSYYFIEMSQLLGLPVDIVVIDSLREEKDGFSWWLVMESGKG